MAPTRAPKITRGSTTVAATMPRPTVSATCRPKNRNAMKLKNAAHATAYCGRSTRVETIVAIEFAASWKPFMKSKASASTIRNTISSMAMVVPVMAAFAPASSPRPGVAVPRASRVLEDDALDHVRDVLALVRHRLQELVHLLQLD